MDPVYPIPPLMCTTSTHHHVWEESESCSLSPRKYFSEKMKNTDTMGRRLTLVQKPDTDIALRTLFLCVMCSRAAMSGTWKLQAVSVSHPLAIFLQPLWELDQTLNLELWYIWEPKLSIVHILPYILFPRLFWTLMFMSDVRAVFFSSFRFYFVYFLSLKI